ncbi:multidrug effflux MFS transporter [Aureispira anguillae]|uniref:Multidrug effflux MFS transporter n=1 Tax=Aureispira anguillae TaxID=2864201 RepID=A0A915VKJ7_9BACT|nr:multidrug effflux MFS transporter [Aureispira anguillae]BDS09716.1 multidrug effflux MFS transporter [Aureispira anguillae]
MRAVATKEKTTKKIKDVQSTQPKKIQFVEFVVLMAMMMSLTALSIDAMLPALSIIGDDLGVQNPNDNQLTISSLFLGLAFGQLIYGPISDSTGRKTPLYGGLLIFILGSLISIFSTSLTSMIIGRTIQGFGLASPRTVSLAMIRDQFKGREMAKVMSFVMMIFILVPTLAPGVGQLILYLADWKAIFIFIGFMALGILIWFATRMHETLAVEEQIPFSFKRIQDSIVEICTNKIALGYTLTAGLVSSAFIGFLNSAQQVFQDQYNLGTKFPIYFAVLAMSIGVASFVNGKLVMRYGTQRMVKTAITGLVGIALFFIGLVPNLEGTMPLWLTMGYLVATLFCIGILFGNLNSMAMEPLGHIAGIGSAIVGSLSTFIAVGIGTIIGLQYDGTLIPIIYGFALSGGASWLLIFRIGAIKGN